MHKRDKAKELQLNRPWRYIPAVIGHMRRWPWSAVRRRIKFKDWLSHVLHINWYVAYVHGDEPVYDACTKCVCFKCANSTCSKKNCTLCDIASKFNGDSGMVTTVCGRAGKISEEADV